MTIPDHITDHIIPLAARIRRGSPPSQIGATTVAWTNEAWKYETTRPDAETIKAAYPGEFA